MSGKPFAVTETSPMSTVKGQVFLFESPESRTAFEKEPQKYVIPFRK